MNSRKSPFWSNCSQKMREKSVQSERSEGFQSKQSQSLYVNQFNNIHSNIWEISETKNQLNIQYQHFNPEEENSANQIHFYPQNDKKQYELTQRSESKIEHFQKPQMQTSYTDKILSQKYRSKILQKKALQQFMGKNINMPKFIVRLFIKYLHLYKGQFQTSNLLSYYNKFERYCKYLANWTKKSKKNTFNLCHINKVLSFDFNTDNLQIQKQGSILCRKVMATILGQFMFQEIIVSYLNTVKTFRLRCLNSFLITRMQSK